MAKLIDRKTEWNFNYDELIRAMEKKRGDLHLSKRAMMLEIGLEPSHLTGLYYRKFMPSIRTLLAISSWLKVHPAHFFYKLKHNHDIPGDPNGDLQEGL